MTDDGRIAAAEEKVESLLRELMEMKRELLALRDQLRAAQGGNG
jgi:hypothetical protein